MVVRMVVAATVAITIGLVGLPWTVPPGSIAGAAEVGVDCASGDLQQALTDANDGDTIVISGTCTDSYRIPDGAELTIKGNPADGPDGFDGAAAPQRSLSGHNVEVTLEDLFFRNSRSTTEGGALSITGTIAVTLDGLRFENNVAEGGGGGGANLASLAGDAATPTAIPIIVRDSVFGAGTMTNTAQSGTTSGHGGALRVSTDKQSIEVRGSTFAGNSAEANGGGAHLTTGTGNVTFTTNTADQNRARGSGGGVVADGVNLVVEDNMVTGNRADARSGVDGGGSGGAHLVAGDDATAEVNRNTFSGNTTAADAGGASIGLGANTTANLADNLFTENTLTADTRCDNTHFGGGLLLRALGAADATATARQNDNVFGDNSIEPAASISGTCTDPDDHAPADDVGDAAGGGEYLESVATTSKNDQYLLNTIENAIGADEGDVEGGGLAVVGPRSSFSGQNLVVAANEALGRAAEGGGVYVGGAQPIVLLLLNSTVTANRAISPSVGPGIFGGASDRLVMTNTIVVGNDGGSGATPDIVGFGGETTVRHSDACVGSGLTGGPYPGAGNICANPMLADPGAGDVHQTAASPTRDAGLNAAVPPDLTADYEGESRIADGNADGNAVVDMGADEVVPRANLSAQKAASESSVRAGSNVAFVVTAANAGPDAAINTRITDPLPATTRFVSATPTSGGTCQTPAPNATGTVTCTWAGSTASGASRAVTIVVNTTQAGTVANTGTVSSDAIDSAPDNNAASASVTVTGASGATGGTAGDGVTPPGSIDIGDGYCMLAEDGGIFTFGGCKFFGAAATGPIVAPQSKRILNAPMVGFAMTPSDLGYWMAGADGGVFTFGDAPFLGSMGGTPLNSPIVGIASTPSGKGYHLVAADGGVFVFGDAKFFGSMGGTKLNQPIVNIVVTPSGAGYWMVASDGGIFSFGDAKFFGSTGGMKLNKPVIGMASRPGGLGYWLVATDGGIFSFGDAPFLGSMGGTKLNQPIVAMKSTSTGKGYFLVANDGGIFTFGDALFAGSMGGTKLNQPIVDLTG